MTEHVEPATFPSCDPGFAGTSRSARPHAKTLGSLAHDDHDAAYAVSRKIRVCLLHLYNVDHELDSSCACPMRHAFENAHLLGEPLNAPVRSSSHPTLTILSSLNLQTLTVSDRRKLKDA